LSAATSSQAAAVGAAVVVGAAVDAGEAVVGLVWLGVELVPQPAKTQSMATAATAADVDRRTRRSRITVFS
jgi:hypothetical protein